MSGARALCGVRTTTRATCSASDVDRAQRRDRALQRVAAGEELDGQAAGDGGAVERETIGVAAHQREPLVERARIGRRAGGREPRRAHARLGREAPTCSALAAVPNAALDAAGRGHGERHGRGDLLGAEPEGDRRGRAAAAGAPAVQVACQPAA